MVQDKRETSSWKDMLPVPVCQAHPEYNELYEKAWELAHDHIKDIPGMPQTPYMDEAFCETQIWIWDSCFMSLFCKYAGDIFPGVETLDNFYQVLYNGKKLPQVIPPVNEPSWTKATPGVPYRIRVHLADNPPLFAWAEYENALIKGDLNHVKELLQKQQFLQKHYEWLEQLRESTIPEGVLMRTHFAAEADGYRWEGGCSGMDNTPRGRLGEHAKKARPNNPDMLWLDAICQQALSARMIAALYALIEDADQEAFWLDRYEEKRERINRFYWDPQDLFYYDIDRNTHAHYKVKTVASFWTLTAGAASAEQAKALAAHLSNPETFGGFVPLVSLARNDSDYNPKGGYWRGSLWLPTAYAALKGLVQYGFYQEAHAASCRILEHMYRTYAEYTPHTIWECYAPEAYEPAVNEHDKEELVRPDFCGWSALGPISIYLEFVLGFHRINAFKRLVEWEKPKDLQGRIGVRNLRFGSVVTDIEAHGDMCIVTSSQPYTLTVNGVAYEIHAGRNELHLYR